MGTSPDPSSPYRLGTDTGTTPMTDTYSCIITFDSMPRPVAEDEVAAKMKQREENMAHERQLWRERRKELRKHSKI